MDASAVYRAAEQFFTARDAPTKKAAENALIRFTRSSEALEVCLQVLEDIALNDGGLTIATLMGTTLRSRARKTRAAAELVPRLLKVAMKFSHVVPIVRNIACAIASGFLFQTASGSVKIPIETLLEEVVAGIPCALWVLWALPCELKETNFGAPNRLQVAADFSKLAKTVLSTFNDFLKQQSHQECAAELLLEAGIPWVEIADPSVLATTGLSHLLTHAHRLVGSKPIGEHFIEAMIDKTAAIGSEESLFHQFLLALKPHLHIPEGCAVDEKRCRLKLCLYALDASKRHDEMYQALLCTDHPASFIQIMRQISHWRDASICLPTFRILTQAKGECPHMAEVITELRRYSKPPDDETAKNMTPCDWEEFHLYREDLRDFLRVAITPNSLPWYIDTCLNAEIRDWRDLCETLHSLSALAKRILQSPDPRVADFLRRTVQDSETIRSSKPLLCQYLITATVFLPIFEGTWLVDLLQLAIDSLQYPISTPGDPWLFRSKEDHAGVVLLLIAAPTVSNQLAKKLLETVLRIGPPLQDCLLTQALAKMASKDKDLSEQLLRVYFGKIHESSGMSHFSTAVRYCGGHAPAIFPDILDSLFNVASLDCKVFSELLNACAVWPSLAGTVNALLCRLHSEVGNSSSSTTRIPPVEDLCNTACILSKTQLEETRFIASRIFELGTVQLESAIVHHLSNAQSPDLGGSWSEHDLVVAYALLNVVRQAQLYTDGSIARAAVLLVVAIVATDQEKMSFPNPATKLLDALPTSTLRVALRHVVAGEMLGTLLTRSLLKAIIGNMVPSALGSVVQMLTTLVRDPRQDLDRKRARDSMDVTDKSPRSSASFVEHEEFSSYLFAAIRIENFPLPTVTDSQKEKFVQNVLSCKKQQQFKMTLKRFCGGKKRTLNLSSPSKW